MPSVIGTRQIRLVHVAKTKLGLTDDEYRAALSASGAASSKDLTWEQYRDLMAHFAQCGFVVQGAPASQPDNTPPLLRKIHRVLEAEDKPRAYADSMASRMFKIDKAAWCNGEQLRKILAAMIYHQKRQGGKEHGK